MINRDKFTEKEDKVFSMAMANLWYFTVVEPIQQNLDIMKEEGINLKDIERVMITMGINHSILWRHNEEYK